jgi:hypothetical protein
MTTTMSTLRRLLASSVMLALVTTSGAALAQSDSDRAAARDLATQGLQAFEAGRWAEAETLFTRAEAIVHAPPHLLYYARASVKEGKLIQANEAYVKILRERLPDKAPRAFLEAQQAAAAEQPTLDQAIPRVTIVVEGEGARDARVTINGADFSKALVGIAAPRDPGELTIAASAPGWKRAETKLVLKEGARETVKLTLATREVRTADTAPKESPPPRNGLRAAAWVTLGVGVLALGAGTYFLIDNRNNRQSANDLCNLPDGGCPSNQRDTIQSYDSNADRSAVLSVIGYGVGGATVIAGTVMMLKSRGKTEPAPKAASVTPWVGPASVGLRGTF